MLDREACYFGSFTKCGGRSSNQKRNGSSNEKAALMHPDKSKRKFTTILKDLLGNTAQQQELGKT